MPANLTIPVLKVEPVQHAFLGGSTAGIWMRCTGAPTLWRTLGSERPGRAAAHGSALHRVMEELIKPRVAPEARLSGPPKVSRLYEPADFLRTLVQVSGYPDPVEIGSEDVDLLAYALDFAETIIAGAELVVVERKVHPTVSGVEVGEMFGYVDIGALRIRRAGGFKLYVVDFKFGWEPVGAESHQLAYYAVGLLDTLRRIKPGLHPQILEIEATIVQPKLQRVDSMTYDLSALTHSSADIQGAYREYQRGEGELRPGEWCKWCKARAICPALRQELIAFPDQAPSIDVDDFPALLAKARLARQAAAAVEHAALRYIGNGGNIPGFKVVKTRSVETWKVKGKDAAAVLLKRGVDRGSIFKAMVRTPKQLRRTGNVEAAALADLTKVSETFAVVPSEDRRPAVVPSLGFADGPDFEPDDTDDNTDNE